MPICSKCGKEISDGHLCQDCGNAMLNEKKDTTNITVSLDRNPEIEALNSEVARLKAEQEASAVAHFSEQCRHYDIDENDPKALDMLKAKKLLEELDKQTGTLHAPKGGETTSFGQNLYEPTKEKPSPEVTDMVNLADPDVPISLMRFSSEEAMIGVLKKIADPLNSDPRRIGKKSFGCSNSKRCRFAKCRMGIFWKTQRFATHKTEKRKICKS